MLKHKASLFKFLLNSLFPSPALVLFVRAAPRVRRCGKR